MKFVIALIAALAAMSVQAERVNGYVRSNGTYVQPYERTAPNSNPYDNYSTKGNTNPYTGQVGTRCPYGTYSC